MHANVNGFSGLHTLDKNNVTCTQTHAARNFYEEKVNLKPLFRCNTRATIASDAMCERMKTLPNIYQSEPLQHRK